MALVDQARGLTENGPRAVGDVISYGRISASKDVARAHVIQESLVTWASNLAKQLTCLDPRLDSSESPMGQEHMKFAQAHLSRAGMPNNNLP